MREVDRRQRDHLLHDGVKLALEVGLQNLRAVHGIREVHVVDVPAANDEIVRRHHGKHFGERNVHVVAALVCSEAEGRRLRQRAEVVRLLDALARAPRDPLAVGDDASGDGGAVVAAETDNHHADAGNPALGLEGVLRGDGGGDGLAIIAGDNASALVDILGGDELVRVLDVRRAHLECRLVGGH
eukprot:Amastigsp_a841014_52645.p2 type:complete len:185 gc:universal Amastigsp_a841014_52645:612-1166(+)